MQSPGTRLTRFLLWVGSFLLVATITATLGTLDGPGARGRNLSDEVIRNCAEAEPSIVIPGGRSVGPYQELAACWELQVAPHGTREAPAVTCAAKAPEKNIEEVLCVRLVYTTSGGEGRASVHYLEEPAVSVAAPERRGARESAMLVAAGDRLRPPYDGEPYHGRVKAITPHGVLFLWRGAEVLLRARRLGSDDLTPGNGIEVAPEGEGQ